MRFLLLACALFACGVSTSDTDDSPTQFIDTGPHRNDLDGDPYWDDVDCNDHQYSIHPGATEHCDGIDEDCDGLIDEGLDGTQELCPAVDCTVAGKGLVWVSLFEQSTLVECDDGGRLRWNSDLAYTLDTLTIETPPLTDSQIAISRWANLSDGWTVELDAVANPDTVGCYPVFARANIALPFTVSEWQGAIFVKSASSGGEADDTTEPLDWGYILSIWLINQAIEDCPAYIRIGTNTEVLKAGGDWGADWSEIMPTGTVSVSGTTNSSELIFELGDNSRGDDRIYIEWDLWIK